MVFHWLSPKKPPPPWNGKPFVLGVDSPFCSTIVLFKNQLFPLGFCWFSEKKDPWKEWTWKCPLDVWDESIHVSRGAERLTTIKTARCLSNLHPVSRLYSRAGVGVEVHWKPLARHGHLRRTKTPSLLCRGLLGLVDIFKMILEIMRGNRSGSQDSR